MRSAVAAVVALALVFPAGAGAATVRRDGLLLGPTHRWKATAYSAYCGTGGGTVTASGGRVYFGEVAVLPGSFLGWRWHTLIRLRRRIWGRRYFRVEDHIGWGSQLDVYYPVCGVAENFDPRRVAFRVVLRRLR